MIATLVLVITPAAGFSHLPAADEIGLRGAELAYCKSFSASAEHVAARYCAKRAYQVWAQAEGVRMPRLNEMEVRSALFGAPQLRLHGAARGAAKAAGTTALHLSLSHCHSHAGALLAVTNDPTEVLRCDESW